MKTTSEFALQTLAAKITPVSDFSHNFRELEDGKGAAIIVPNFTLSAATEFNESTNNYFSGVREVDGATVNLNKHFMKSCAYSDKDVIETDVQFARDYGIGIGDTLGRAIYTETVGVLSSATLSASFTGTTKAQYADLFGTVYENNLDIS